jgi:hypothetical protein
MYIGGGMLVVAAIALIAQFGAWLSPRAPIISSPDPVGYIGAMPAQDTVTVFGESEGEALTGLTVDQFWGLWKHTEPGPLFDRDPNRAVVVHNLEIFGDGRFRKNSMPTHPAWRYGRWKILDPNHISWIYDLNGIESIDRVTAHKTSMMLTDENGRSSMYAKQ